ncbi:MAG: helix-turn-helix domain-containing protein [Pseudomonadota bacterium]
MSTIGIRLKNERERLGLNQTEFAQLAGHSRSAQAGYERDEKIPGGAYLQMLADNGCDVLYVLTGKKLPPIDDINSDEVEIIKLYRKAPLSVKAAIYGALTSSDIPSGNSTINVKGSGQRIAGRDFHENKK